MTKAGLPKSPCSRARRGIWIKPHLRPADGGTRGRIKALSGRFRSANRVIMVDLSQYLPILIFLVIALGLSTAFVFLPMGVSMLTGTHNPNAEKNSEYECGFPAFEDPRSQFDVRFDLTGWPGWITMMVFLGELLVGLAYAWKVGALDWE
jgi:NADH-quinone oxidoreductase subunit A